MIKIEDTNSELFESAYFIIRQNVPLPKKTKREDIIREAAKIVGEKLEPNRSRKREKRRLWVERAIVFIVGAVASAVVAAIMWWVM